LTEDAAAKAKREKEEKEKKEGSTAATVYKAPKKLPNGEPTSQNYPFTKPEPDLNDPWQYNPMLWNFFDGFVSPYFNVTTFVLKLIGNNNLDLTGSFNCVNCTNSSCAANSTNLTNSTKILLSTNITTSFYVYNSTNLRRSYNVSNSSHLNYSRHASASRNGTRIRSSSNIINGNDVRDSDYCYNCTNCVHCYYCSNVTNGFNLTNVTNSYTVQNVINGTNLTHVSDSANVSSIFNGTNLVNASNCSYCNNNSNCTGGECNITKFAKDLAEIVNKKLMEQSYTIIDQLYTFYRVGKPDAYTKRNSSFDPELIRSQQKYFDLSTRNVLFEVDGVKLDYSASVVFREDPNPLKEAALQYLLQKEAMAEDEQFNIVNKGGLDQPLVDWLNKEMDLEYLDNFSFDIDRVPIPFKYVANRTEEELESEQAYYDSLAVDCHVTEEDKAGAVPQEASQATEAKKATRKLVGAHKAANRKGKKHQKTHSTHRKLKKEPSKKSRSVGKTHRMSPKHTSPARKPLKHAKYVVKKIMRKMV
jgi:hypothetical protein